MAFNFSTGSTIPSFTAGSSVSKAPTFSGFGTTPAGTTPANAGFSFGAMPTTTTPALGFGFGTNTTATTTSAGFGFGGLGGGIGTNTSTAPTLFTGFGSTTSTTTSAPTFSFSGLGAQTTAPTSTGTFAGGLGGGSMFQPSAFSSGLGNYGSSLGGTNTFGQSSFATPGFGANPFGAGMSTAPGLGANVGSAFPSLGQVWQGMNSLPFGAGANPFATNVPYGQPVLGQAAPNQALTNLATALSCPLVFGDERDVILAKWNKLQAFWGTGKGVFSSSGQFAEFSPDNPFCRFKAIGYSRLPTTKNDEGFVALTINKKSTDIVNHQQQLVDSIHRVMGSRPTLSVCVEGVKPIPEDKTEVIMYVLERAPTGVSRRVSSSELFSFLMQPATKNQLSGLGIEGVVPKSAPTKEQLQQFLDNPPAGIDPRLWEQAKMDNPDPENLIPVPMIGFKELQMRLKCQDEETKQHQGRLDLIADDIQELQRCHANSMAKIAELKRKQLDLGHRVLKVMVRQEIARKMGFAIQGEEEHLRVQLEALQAELNAPTKFKGRLNELMSQIRMQNHHSLVRSDEHYAIDSNLQDDMKQVLKQQQEGITHLINIIRTDLEDLKLMEKELKENVLHR